MTILTLGSRGDVEPYVALGRGLQAAGHDVRIATHAMFKTFVNERKLDFFPIVADPVEISRTEAARDWVDDGGDILRWARGLHRTVAPIARHLASDCWVACQNADVIVAGVLGSFLGYHIAERLRVPLVRAFLSPVTPTRYYPADTSLTPLGERLGGHFNLLTHMVYRQFIWLLFRPLVNTTRREVLHLPPLPWRHPLRELDRRRGLLLYGFSPAVSPKPPDWPDRIHVTGNWLLDDPPDWQPPVGLAEFLADGPPPVYVGFGSVNDRDPARTTRLVVEALASAGQRGVLVTGWGGLDGSDRLPESVFAVDEVPSAGSFRGRQPWCTTGGGHDRGRPACGSAGCCRSLLRGSTVLGAANQRARCRTAPRPSQEADCGTAGSGDPGSNGR